MNFNLGNYGSQLSLDEQNKAFSNVSRPSDGYGPPPVANIVTSQQPAAPIVPADHPAQANAVGSTNPSSYIPASYQPPVQEQKKEKSGLDNALGIVGKIVAFL